MQLCPLHYRTLTLFRWMQKSSQSLSGSTTLEKSADSSHVTPVIYAHAAYDVRSSLFLNFNR